MLVAFQSREVHPALPKFGQVMVISYTIVLNGIPVTNVTLGDAYWLMIYGMLSCASELDKQKKSGHKTCNNDSISCH